MRFPLPLFPAEFEVPDLWWEAAGAHRRDRMDETIRCSDEGCEHVGLDQIQPPVRYLAYPGDFHGFEKARMISVLKGMSDRNDIPAVRLLVLPPSYDISGDTYRFRVLDGFHRLYAAIALGYMSIPALVRGPQS